jgi:hypothetical protein
MIGTGGGRNGAASFVIGFAFARTDVVVTDETFSGNLNKTAYPCPSAIHSLPFEDPRGSSQSSERIGHDQVGPAACELGAGLDRSLTNSASQRGHKYSR